MEEFFWRALTTACVVSVFLAVLLFPAWRWLTGRYAPQVRWGLWRGLAAVLIFGVFFSGFAAVPETKWEVPAYSVTLPAVAAGGAEQSGGEPASDLPEAVTPTVPAETNPAGEESGAISQDHTPAPETPAPPEITVSAASIAGAVWLAVAAGVLLWQGIRYARVKRRLLASSAPTGAWDAVAREMGAKTAVRVLPGLESPMALGIFHPVVLLPEGKVPLLAVRHELTHILRHDLAGKGLLFLACALYWFDPLVWYMARVAGEDMEAACDARLVRDMTAAEKRAYGELLLCTAVGGSTVPVSTRFGGSREQMKSRLTQLFRPGKPSRTLTGVLLAAAFAVTGLVACGSGGHSAMDVEDAVLYASFGYFEQPEDTDYKGLTLTLVDFVPGADWVGGSSGTVTLPVSEDVCLSGTRVSEEEWRKQLFNFLYAPMLSSYALPGTTDVICVEIQDGVITAMDWFEGMEAVGGVLWQDADYGQFFPYVLRLPESWRDRFDTVAALGRDGENHITDYSVEFYRKGTRELLFTLNAQKLADFHDQYGYDDAELNEQGIWLLGIGGDWCFYGEVAKTAGSEDDMAEDLLAQLGEECFAWLGTNTYTSERYGFTLEFPDSWQGHYYAEETLQGVDFYYRTDLALLCSLIVRTEPASQEELSTGRMKLAGSGNGWYVYLSMPQAVPANLFENMAQGLRYQRVYQDFLRLFEEDAWELTFAQGDDAVHPALPSAVEPGLETRAAFVRVLRNLTESSTLPDGTHLEDWDIPSDYSDNSFAVADVDGDGKEELVLYFVTSNTAGMRGYVVGYDSQKEETFVQLTEFPDIEFYGNGAVKAMYSHNQIGGALWPYTLYTYEPESDSYRQEALVYSWEKRIRGTNDNGEPFPDELDRSGTGVIYYVEPDGWDDSNPMDREDYLAWEREALEGSEQLTLRFLPLTEENIASLESFETP